MDWFPPLHSSLLLILICYFSCLLHFLSPFILKPGTWCITLVILHRNSEVSIVISPILQVWKQRIWALDNLPIQRGSSLNRVVFQCCCLCPKHFGIFEIPFWLVYELHKKTSLILVTLRKGNFWYDHRDSLYLCSENSVIKILHNSQSSIWWNQIVCYLTVKGMKVQKVA